VRGSRSAGEMVGLSMTGETFQFVYYIQMSVNHEGEKGGLADIDDGWIKRGQVIPSTEVLWVSDVGLIA